MFSSSVLPVGAAETYSLGDCNRDGMVNASDATDVLKYYSSLSTGGDVWTSDKVGLADMDGDSKVDSTDTTGVYLDKKRTTLKYDKWFFGKHHINKQIPPRFFAVFDSVIDSQTEKTLALLK